MSWSQAALSVLFLRVRHARHAAHLEVQRQKQLVALPASNLGGLVALVQVGRHVQQRSKRKGRAAWLCGQRRSPL
jgi:hypothetical protein